MKRNLLLSCRVGALLLLPCRQIRWCVGLERVERADLGHAPSAHERARRLHVPHLLQLSGADLARGDAGERSRLQRAVHVLRLAGLLVGLLVGPLIGRLVCWLVRWLVGWLICSLVDWLLDRLIHQLVGWLIDWLIDWLINWLIDWLIAWSIDWLEWNKLNNNNQKKVLSHAHRNRIKITVRGQQAT